MTATLDTDLVLEGGGVDRIRLAGAISVLGEDETGFHQVAGTSASAIVNRLVAAGATRAMVARCLLTRVPRLDPAGAEE